MYINLKEVPFSSFGSYFAISYPYGPMLEKDGLYLRTLHGGRLEQEYFKLELTDGKNSIRFNEKVSPTLLRLEASDGFIEICFNGPQVLRVRGKGVGLRLVRKNPGSYVYAMPYANGIWEINGWSSKLMLISLKGNIRMDAPWESMNCMHIQADFLPETDSGLLECAIEEFFVSWKNGDSDRSFDECHQKVKAGFQEWLEKTPAVPPEYAEARELAAYVNWSSVVKALGNVKRPAMFMSKNWMNNVWSWDHCFNAMALSKFHPQMAWDQFMLMVDHQDEDGAFPDCFNDRGFIWSFSKPPIHGWVLDWMMKHSEFISIKHLKEAYEALEQCTKWWMKHRDYDGNGIPQYNHGNDSGWDNSTVFREGVPVETPDLTAFLILQMEVLGDIAAKLGMNKASTVWQTRSRDLTQRMVDYFWQEDHFVARHSGSHKVIESDSLLLYIPLILGKRLPSEVVGTLVGNLKAQGRFLTPYGFATESVLSPFYTPDGYWRGPIWAPPTMILVEALFSVGEESFARDIARRYCAMFAKSGAAENFDALTGKGLRDMAYTWTSSVFLILANEYI